MTVQEWINKGKDYHLGVQLYSAMPYANRMLIANFLRKESDYNHQKLFYELSKNMDIDIPITGYASDQSLEVEELQEQVETLTSEVELLTDENDDLQARIKALEPPFKKSQIAEFPPELHPTFINRINAFYQWCTLKAQLNALPDEAEEEALQLLIQIDDAQSIVKRCWKVLDYYTETKEILLDELPADVTQLSIPELWQRKQLLHQNISKRKKTIERKFAKLPTVAGKKYITAMNSLQRKQKELFALELERDKIMQLLSNPKSKSS